jgi:hypothetical protein
MGDTPNAETLATVASIVAAVGTGALFFRVPREIKMMEKGQPTWIPGCDRLAIAATLVAIIFGVLPVLLFHGCDLLGRRIPTAACAASLTALACYPLALPAHYGLLFRKGRKWKPIEPLEGVILVIAAILAVVSAVFSLASTA